MCVIRNQMIRCSSKLTVSYLTIITKNHVFPTLANFCRNTKWFRCWKLYPKKKDEKTRHGQIFDRAKNMKVQGSSKYVPEKTGKFQWLTSAAGMCRTKSKAVGKPSPKSSSSTPSKLSCAGASCGNNPMKWKQTKCWRYNA